MKFRFSNLTVAYRTARSLSRTARSHYFGRHIVHPIFVTEDRSCLKTSRRWHGGHSHHHGGRDENDGIFKLGLAADVGLAVGKALTGYASGSTAIIADAAHSISDIVLSGVALLSYRAARAPKDKEHPYGHGKFETLGALGISCMLLATAGGIAWHALGILHSVLISNPDIIDHSLLDNHNHGGHNHAIDLDHPVLALNMTITSIAVKEGLYWITKRAGDKEGGGLLMKANAWHHRADAVSSVVALVGVGGAILGVRFLDPLAGLVVSGMIFKAGIKSGYESVMELVDAGVPFSTLAPIKRTIIEVEGVMGSHRLRGRKAGSSIYLDVHVEVDPFLSVSMAHNIGENVRHQIHKCHRNIAEVFIHIDPSFEYFETTLDKRKETSNFILNENSSYSKEENQKTLVSNILSSQFSKKISVEHITRHLLQGKVFLQIQVSMPSNMLIIDATTIAKEAEKEILKADSSINQVSIQLRLGEQTPQFNNHLNKKNNHNTELYMLQNFTNPQQSE